MQGFFVCRPSNLTVATFVLPQIPSRTRMVNPTSFLCTTLAGHYELGPHLSLLSAFVLRLECRCCGPKPNADEITPP